MSPVSRGRKTKKNKKRRPAQPSAMRNQMVDNPLPDRPRSPLDAIESALGITRQRPSWFDKSIKTVLEGADVLLASAGPRELEQATCELQGAEAYRAAHEEHNGLWFDWWFEELVAATATRIRETDDQDGDWPAQWRLLNGLAAIGSPALESAAQAKLKALHKDMRHKTAYRAQPEWLARLPKAKATGEIWQLRNVYGDRIAVIAGMSYPNGMDKSVYLFDIDASGFIVLVNAGPFDDLRQAATAWRSTVGDTANDAEPALVQAAEQLSSLAHCELDERAFSGTESRALMDNWFLANRRIHEVANALRKQGMSWPTMSLYRDVDIAPMTKSFTDWYADRHGTKPDPEAVEALAEEWAEGSPPDTWHSISPQRIEFHSDLINDDWQSDHPLTIATKAIFPEWIRWHGEQAGLPTNLIDRSATAAAAIHSETP